jgi:hypothetical protein
MIARLNARALPLALVLAAAGQAAHADSLPIVFGGVIDTKLQGEVTRSDKNSTQEPETSPGTKGTLFVDSDFQAYLNYGDWLSLNSDIKLERTRNGNINSYYPTGNAAFRSEAATLRQLYATVRPVDNLAVYGGKIHPKFGSAYSATPGIFYSFGTDYEQDERIGLGGEITLPESLGAPTLSVETFYLDTSFLSYTIGSRPDTTDANAGRVKRIRSFAGGASNTGSFESFTVALQGSDPPQLTGLKYQVSYTHEAVRLPTERAEDGYSAGASYKIPLTHKIDVTPFAEITKFSNFGGANGRTNTYLQTGVALNYGKWELDLSAGQRRVRGIEGTEDTRDHQENISLQYEIIEHVKLGAGYNHVRQSNQPSNTFAVSTTYGWDF